MLWLIMHSYTISSQAKRSARFAVSRALYIYRLVYRPLVKRAIQRNSRRLALCYAQPPLQYSAQRMTRHIRRIMCKQHKNKLKNSGYFV